MIQQIISDVVSMLRVGESNIAPTFIHGWKGWQNLVADEITNEVVFLDEPVQSNDSFSGNYLEESYVISLVFLSKNELDDSPEQILPIVDSQRIQRNKFIYLLKKNEKVRNIASIRTTDLFNVFDVNLSGVKLDLTVTLFNDNSIC